MKPRVIFVCFLTLFLYVGTAYAQNKDENIIPIDNIISNPGKYNNEFVKIRGQVTQYTSGDSQTTASYQVKGDYGSSITVTTMDVKPEVFEIYIVSGTVVIDPYTQEPYVIEKGKQIDSRGASGINNPMVLFGMFGGFLVVTVLIVIVVVRTSKPPKSRGKQLSELRSRGKMPKIDYDNDFKTIRISTEAPKTLRFIPGKLVIISGLDSGKEFMISNYPSKNGNVVSIGRESATGDKVYSHIQLTDKTVSRKQAELIEVDGKLFIKNLSETNYTLLDGEELSPEQEKEVHVDSVIRMGELEFKYMR